MRQIKFKGLTVKNRTQEAGLVVQGSLIVSPSSGRWFIYDERENMREIKKSSTAEYAGINDINGLPLYEKDVCKVKLLTPYYVMIEFVQGCFKVYYRQSDGKGIRICLQDFFDKDKLEYIGNICENADLKKLFDTNIVPPIIQGNNQGENAEE